MSLILTRTGVAGVGIAEPGSSPPAPTHYHTVQASIANLVALWSNASTDSIGTRHAALTGNTPSTVNGLPANSDTAQQFDGASYRTVTHDAGLLLSAFTLSFWVQLTQAPTANWNIITKDRSGHFDGDMLIRTDSGRGLTAQFQYVDPVDGNVTAKIELAAGTLTIGTAYHVLITAGTAGLKLFLQGVHRGTADGYTGAWSENPNNLIFAGNPFGSPPFAGIVDEIALYSRILTDAEIVTLSQRTAAPTSFAVSGVEVNEGETVPIGAIASCTFLGQQTGLTIEFIQGSHGTLSADASKNLSYAAGATAGGQTDSPQYRITDPAGTSAYATIGVTIADTSAGEPTDLPFDLNPIPFIPSDSGAVTVASMADLENAIETATPGLNIRIADGTYAGGTRTITPIAAGDNPVIVRPLNARDMVTINGARWTISGGSGLVFHNLYWNDARNTLTGGLNRFRCTRNRFRQVGGVTWNLFAVNNFRFDHIDFSDLTVNTGCFARFRHTEVGNGDFRRALFDHFDCHDIADSDGSDNPLFGQSSSSGGALFADPEVVFSHMLLRALDGSGELFGTKSEGWHFQYCTWDNVAGLYTNMPRNGSHYTLRSCWFGGGGRNPKIQMFSDNGLMIGCHFDGTDRLDINAGTTTRDETIAAGAQGAGNYNNCRNWDVIACSLGTGTLRVGGIQGSLVADEPALNTLIAGCTRNGAAATTSNGITLLLHSGTTITTVIPTEYIGTYTAAVRLTAADVGLAAPDPFDPTGPQT